MPVLKGGEKLEQRLAELSTRVSRAATLEVGFPSTADTPDGEPIAQYAAAQEFGAPSRGIPPRPFFRNMIAQESPQWGAMAGEVLKRTAFDANKALEHMGEVISQQLKESIIDTNDPPLKPATIARKGSAKPLVDHGYMLAAVNFTVHEGGNG